MSSDTGHSITFSSPDAVSVDGYFTTWLPNFIYGGNLVGVWNNVKGVTRYTLDSSYEVELKLNGQNLTYDSEAKIYPISSDGVLYVDFSSCLEENTLISMHDGSFKKVRDIEVGDRVLALNPYTSEFEEDEVVACDGRLNKTADVKDVWTLDDGTTVETVHPHEFYNVRLGRMEYISEFIVGEDKVMKSDKTEHMLVGHERIEGEFRHCTLFTRKFNTYFANRILAGNRDSAKWGWKSRS